MRGARPSLVALLLASGCAAGCGGESPQSGLTAWLRVSGGQYEPGELTTDPGAIEPTVDTITSRNNNIFPGAQSRSITGSVNGAAASVLMGLEGDSAHWLIPVGVPDFEIVGNFIFSASVSYSPDLPTGPRALRVRAIDADGNLGPIQALGLSIGTTAPTGALVVQLDWDTEADLDLHLRIIGADPSAPPLDVWNKAPLALPQKSSSEPPYTRAEIAAAGRLQFDSNSQCVIDGARHEEVVFPQAVPPGTYEVRVDTFSLCSEATARWHVAAFTNPIGTPTLIQEAFGQSMDRDTLVSHGADSGLLAFSFTQPTQP
ncbi:MAG TPA: hypothetical protein VGK52_01440 [Polyangia bacterium]|jgi:hypothetical protein